MDWVRAEVVEWVGEQGGGGRAVEDERRVRKYVRRELENNGDES